MAMWYTNPDHQTNMQTQGYISNLFILQFHFFGESKDYCSQPSSMWLCWRPQGTPASSFKPYSGSRGWECRENGGRCGARTLHPIFLLFLLHRDISVKNWTSVTHRYMTSTLCSSFITRVGTRFPFICSINIYCIMILCQGLYNKVGQYLSRGLHSNRDISNEWMAKHNNYRLNYNN